MNILKQYATAMWQNRPQGLSRMLWPAVWSLWLANHGFPRIVDLLLFIVFSCFTYCLVYVLEDLAIHRGHSLANVLTNLPIVAKRISGRVRWLLCVLSFIVLAGLSLLVNWVCFGFVVTAALLACLYEILPTFKYKTKLFTLFLLIWIALLPFLFVSSHLPIFAYFFALIVLLWWLLDEIIYHIVNHYGYLLLPIAILQILIVSFLAVLGVFGGLDVFYFLGLLGILGIYLYQRLMIKGDRRDQYEKMIAYNRYVGLIIFAGIFISYL